MGSLFFSFLADGNLFFLYYVVKNVGTSKCMLHFFWDFIFPFLVYVAVCEGIYFSLAEFVCDAKFFFFF